HEGVILGTAAYMSPEQARGQTVDKRTDIWAFGCVLYEMLASKPAFSGETLSDTIAAISNANPTGVLSRKRHQTPFDGCWSAVSRRICSAGSATSAMHASTSTMPCH